jgi:hypothetical protein
MQPAWSHLQAACLLCKLGRHHAGTPVVEELPMPKLNTVLIEDTIDRDLYTLSRVSTHKVVHVHTHLLQIPHDHFMAAIAVRNKHADVCKKADGLLDNTWWVLESRTAPGYTRLWTIAPSGFVAAPERDRVALVTGLVGAIEDAQTPALLQTAAGPLVAAAKEFLAAAHHSALVDAQLAEAMEAVDKALNGCLDGLATMRNALGMVYPRQPKLVARFFRPTKKASVKAGKAAVVPA